MGKDYYKILGVSRDVSEADLKKGMMPGSQAAHFVHFTLVNWLTSLWLCCSVQEAGSETPSGRPAAQS